MAASSVGTARTELAPNGAEVTIGSLNDAPGGNVLPLSTLISTTDPACVGSKSLTPGVMTCVSSCALTARSNNAERTRAFMVASR